MIFWAYVVDIQQTRILMPMGSADLVDVVKRSLLQYSREFNELELYMFPEVAIHFIRMPNSMCQTLEYIVRVDRVLSQPKGSILMAGSSGAGRRNILSLVAYMHQMTVISPKITRGYTVKVFLCLFFADSLHFSAELQSRPQSCFESRRCGRN
jgi:dynein heavy chain 2